MSWISYTATLTIISIKESSILRSFAEVSHQLHDWQEVYNKYSCFFSPPVTMPCINTTLFHNYLQYRYTREGFLIGCYLSINKHQQRGQDCLISGCFGVAKLSRAGHLHVNWIHVNETSLFIQLLLITKALLRLESHFRSILTTR